MKHRNISIGIAMAIVFSAAPGGGFQDVRTLDTRVADILAKMPATGSEQMNQVSLEMIALGSEGLKEVCEMLVPSETGGDANVRFALNGLAHYAARPAGESDRKLVVDAFIKALDSASNEEVKAFLIRQIQLVGRDESVEPLAEYLEDERLCDPASQALVAVGTKYAENELLQAVTSVKEPLRVAVIKGLGELRSNKAVKKIKKYATVENTGLRRISLWALANIGHPSAEKILADAAATSQGYERAKATSYYLLYAQRLAETGKADGCVRICRELIQSRVGMGEDHVASAALRLLVSLLGKRAFGYVLAAMDSGSKKFIGAALECSEAIPGETATMAWTEKMAVVPPEIQAAIIHMLGKRGDRAALPILLGKVHAEEPSIRREAILASARLGRNEVLPALMEVLEAGEKNNVGVIRQAMLSYTDKGILPKVAEAVPRMPSPGRIVLIEVLAARKAKEHRDIVFDQTAEEDTLVRLAAMEALDDLAEARDLPRLLDLLSRSHDEPEILAIQEAIVASTRQVPDEETRADQVLDRYYRTSNIEKRALMATLPKIGGLKPLKAVVAETNHEDADLRSAAIRALAEWPDFEAAEPLLQLSTAAKEAGNRSIALKGYVRLVDESEKALSEKFEFLATALGAAKSPEEKKIVLSGFTSARTHESLSLVAAFLDDVDLKQDAAEVCMTIACPQHGSDKGLAGAEVVTILEKVRDILEDEYDQKRVQQHLDTISSAEFSRLNQPPEGFYALFNGRDLTGWRRHDNLPGHGLAGKWTVEDGLIVGVQDPPGEGGFLTTTIPFQDFELLLETKIDWPFDSGVFLRVGPDGKSHQITLDYREGGEVGSIYMSWTQGFVYHCPGGVEHFKKDEWNQMRIVCEGEPAHIRVWLNGILITDFQHTEETTKGVPEEGTIALQVHPGGEGYDQSKVRFRNIFIREIPRTGEWRVLFNGQNFDGWVGATDSYYAQEGRIICPKEGGGNLYTEDEFSDFVLRFQFKLTPGANNGLGIRAPLQGDAAYVGMELQILDNSAHIYRNLQSYQYHGSIYGVVPARRGYLRPVGEWNFEEVIARGRRITVNLNGVAIVDADIDEASRSGPIDGNQHPGLKREKGHIGFLGHGSHVEFRHILIKELN